jgi:transcription antitermination factor NusG
MDSSHPSHWYALNVEKNREHFVFSCLHQMQVEAFLPLQKASAHSRKAKHSVARPLFPGYLFCHVNLDRAPKFYQIPGFRRIVGFGKHPTRIETSEIEIVRSVVEKSVSVEPCPHFGIGDQIKITAGPFVGLPGTVLQTHTLKKLVISLPLLKRSIAVTVPHDWVVPCQTETDP